MKGLELARRYYETYGKDMLKRVEQMAPGISKRAAVGLVGEGSQCFGFDDILSQDHDFAPGFCIWLSDEDFAAHGALLQQAYDEMPKQFEGFSGENIIAADRLGVTSISRFYVRFTLEPKGIPTTPIGWLVASESQLAAATNGEIFRDDEGEFTEIRKKLLNFYPEDVLRKKIAARAAVMSQAGQYNLFRGIQRGDSVATLLALSKFTEATMSMIYLLNRKYMPFYKWAFHGLKDLPLLACDIAPLLKAAVNIPELVRKECAEVAAKKSLDITEDICHRMAEELNRQEFSALRILS